MYRKLLGWEKTVTASRWFHPLLLLVWVGIGTGLRLMHLASKTPWTDEFSTIVFGLGHSFRGVPLDQAISPDVLLQPLQPNPVAGIGAVIHRILDESNHPPVYFVLAHLWMGLFPTQDGLVSLWAARSLPAILGVASIPAMFGLGYLAFRSLVVGQMVAAIMAVSPFGVFLAQEARHYTLAILFVIASLCCLVLATQAIHQRTSIPRPLGLTWVVINALGVATHYFFILTLCAEALVLLIVGWHQSQSKANPQFSPKSWRHIFLIANGTLVGCLVWLPVLRFDDGSDGSLTHWIYDRHSYSTWLEPIGRVIAWVGTTIVSLPMALVTLPLAVVIVCAILTLIFLIWAVLILVRGFHLQPSQPNTRLSVGVIGAYIIGSLAVFFGLTYGLGADLTLAPRYQFVYFPALIVLLGALLAPLWNRQLVSVSGKESYRDGEGGGDEGDEGKKPFSSSLPSACTTVDYSLVSTPSRRWFSAVHPVIRGGKKAVTLIWLVGLVGGLTVAWNFSYLQRPRADLVVNIIQNVSNSPILIATTHQHHGQTGRMMALAWEFKRHNHLASTSHGTSPQFLLAHVPRHSGNNPSVTLQETVAKLPRPLDIWLVNFHAKVNLQQQHCFAVSQSLPKFDGYWNRLYRCPALRVWSKSVDGDGKAGGE